MKIACGTVSYCGRTEPALNERRLDLFCQLLKACASMEVDLVCLPGSYLTAKDNQVPRRVGNKVVHVARTYEIAVAVGIDVKDKVNGSDLQVKRYQLPWFAVCWSPGEKVVHYWRQRSWTSMNCSLAPEHAIREARTLAVREARIEILMCGEIFSPAIRSNIIERREALDAVVDLGHTSQGFRVWAGMKKLAAEGLTTLCSVHTERSHSRKYRYDAGARCKSANDFDIELGGCPRAEFKVWDISP
jgi:hypothetical protein